MTFGQHITALRKRKGLSQNDLGKQIGSSGDIIGKYERDEVKPSIEVVIKIADVLGSSIDFLVGKTDIELDNETLNRIKEVSKLPNEERTQVFKVVDALIRDYNAKKAYQ
jgi:transcriptional regulator with XRE-family HTH domain